MDIHKFISGQISQGLPGAAWVTCPGFKGIYVRVTKRYINEEFIDVIDLANIQAENPGNGVFKTLIKDLIETYPRYTIHVESVQSNKFFDGLVRMGFVQTHIPRNLYMPLSARLLAAQFAALSAQWKMETINLSDVGQIVLNESYQRIIGLGPSALPLIFEALEAQPAWWFPALRAITGEDPVDEDDLGDLEAMRSTWLHWARTNGHR